MGIRFYCPNGHKLNVKSFQAGRVGICPYCGAKVQIQTQSTRKSSKDDTDNGGQNAPVALYGPEDALPLATPAGNTGHSMPGESGGHGAIDSAQPAGSASPSAGIAPGSPPDAGQAAPVFPEPAGPLPVAEPAQPASNPPAMAEPATPVAPVDAVVPSTADLSAAAADPGTISESEPAPPSSDVADPLAEDPDAVWYVRPPSGGQFGPAIGDIMRTWLDDGRVSPDSLVWREGWRDWLEAGDVFPQLKSGQTGPQVTDIAAVSPHLPAGADRSRRRPLGRRKSQTFNTALIVVLVLAVITLSVIFVWVLTNQPGQPEPRTTGSGRNTVTVVQHAPAHPFMPPAARKTPA